MKNRIKLNTRNAILGVLMQGPAHGYRIKKLFAPFIAKEGINDGQLYPVLTRLEQEGLVRKEVVPQRKSPNKNIYSITEQGKAEFARWLLGPDDEIDPVRYDFFLQYAFLVKCIFFEHLPKRSKVAKLERQVESLRQKVSEYQIMRLDMLDRGLSEYKIKIVEYGIALQQLKLRWIEDLLDAELDGEPDHKRKDVFPDEPDPAKTLKSAASRSRRPEKKD